MKPGEEEPTERTGEEDVRIGGRTGEEIEGRTRGRWSREDYYGRTHEECVLRTDGRTDEGTELICGGSCVSGMVGLARRILVAIEDMETVKDRQAKRLVEMQTTPLARLSRLLLLVTQALGTEKLTA